MPVIPIGVAPYNTIAIVNSTTSNRMKDADGASITNALNSLLPTFCSDWNLKPVTVTYVPKGKATTIPLKCFVLDNSDVQGALGYHYEDSDIPYAKIFVKTILDNSGVVLFSTNPHLPTVAAIISHEIFEMLIDIRANTWWNSANGSQLYAAEVCDPVESNIVKVQLKGAPAVGLSDWILPAWSDAQATKGPFNHMNTLKSPLTVDKGGYLIVLDAGQVNNVMGSKISAYTKQNMCSRSLGRAQPKGASNKSGLIHTRTLGYI